jgi:hypothetical protein
MKIIDKIIRKNISKKILFTYITVAISCSVLLPLNANSQGYAGSNKTIMKDSSVVIGDKKSCNNCCYKWSPATGLSSTTVKNPTANPQTTTTYTLKVTGDNFNINDVSQMTVTVKDGMDGLTATPKKCCFKKGDAIKLEDFTITTNPAGLENTVTINPTTVPGNIFLNSSFPFTANSTATLPVTFTARGSNNTTKTATVNINCVDEDVQSQVQVGMGEIKVDDIAKGIDEIINNVANVGGCQKTGGFSSNVSFTTGKLCCAESGCIKPMFAYNGTINYDIGVQCDYPFYGIPYAASINLRVMASAGVAIALGNTKSTCDGADVCFSVSVAGNIGGGLSGTVAGGKILDMSLLLVGQINTPPWEYCVMSGKTKRESNVCIKADLVGSVTLLGYITESVSVSVINQRCW